MKLLALSIIAFACLASCESPTPESVVIEKFRVIEVYKKRPISVHDEINPKWNAVLSNGDTVTCNNYTQVGDSIIYKFIKYGRE